ncbi:MAG: hypothetical protein AAF914_06245 [Pseudomonadota bacterium]
MMYRRFIALAAVLCVAGCFPIQVRDVIEQPGGSATSAAIVPPAGLTAEAIPLRLVDGSPGLGLWCDQRSQCIETARVICDNRQSIRGEFDIDRTAPGAAEFFARSETAPHRLTVSCPV